MRFFVLCEAIKTKKGAETLTNTKKQSNIKHPDTGSYFEIDVFIPSKQLCFEFQDAHHYVTTWYKHSSRAEIELKQLRLNELTLIQVPCWWDASLTNLVASINFQRPDLDLTQSSHDGPISLNPFSESFNFAEVPDIGELMLASFPSEDNFNKTIESNSWWMGEKYDGIRCSWNPIHQQSYGTELPLLPSLIKCHPQIDFVDGEYWFGRELFSLTGGLLKGNVQSVSWHNFRMIGFDSPAKIFHSTPFESRYYHLLSKIPFDHQFMIVPTRILCTGSDHLNYFVHYVMSESGEGIILRRMGSLYQPGRSTDLLKIKAGQVDQEGMVIKIEPMEYVTLKLENGRTFDVAWDQVQLQNDYINNDNEEENYGEREKERKIVVGDVVTFTCENYARHSVPVNPVITRVRLDVPFSFNNKQSSRDTALPMQYWTAHNMRSFLENFAKDKKLNPLVPSTWYTIKESEIRQSKSGNTILKKFYGYSAAIMQLFPDIKFDINSFPKVISLQNVEHRRNFFEAIAQSIGFDPLVPENWYSQSVEKIMSTKGINWVLSYHKNSLSNALSDLFPDIGFDKSQISAPLYGPRNRRRFFEEYAITRGFDPLLPSNWYSQSKESIMSFKGATRVMSYHGDSISKALSELFPEINIDRKKFEIKSPWKEEKDRRIFFERYANNRGFDSLVANNWYSQSLSDIMNVKGTKGIIAYHGHSVATALIELFPEIIFQRELLWQRTLWTNTENRRQFFVQYAKTQNFDWKDTESWYLQPRAQIMAFKGAKAVISYHSNSVSKALIQLFPEIGLIQSKFWK